MIFSPAVRRPRAASAAGAALLLALALAAPSASAQTVVVPEFTAIAVGGHDYDVAEGDDGTLAFIWWTWEGSFKPANYRVYTNTFTAQGVLSGGGRVDENGRLNYPKIVSRPGGFVAAAWNTPANSGRNIQARRLNLAGAPTGGQFLVDDGNSSVGWPAAARLASGGVVFTWPSFYLHGRVYTPQTQPIGSQLQLSEGQMGGLENSLAALANGGFVAVWREIFLAHVTARLYDASGTPVGPQFVADDIATTTARVAAAPNGDFAVLTISEGSVRVRRFDSLGIQLGTTVVVNAGQQDEASGAHLQFDLQGNLYVIWATYNSTGVPAGPVKLRLLSAVNGQPFDAPTVIAAAGAYPRALRLANGSFLNAWRDAGVVKANVVSICGIGSPTCGDGDIDPPCEICDDGGANSDTEPGACRTNCLPAGCGDGIVDPGEECDDGNRVGDDGCDQNCLIESCGNGRVEANEGCDDGNLESGDGCDANCQPTGCGNGVVTGDEECDDGNSANGDGCDAACWIEQCPNGRQEGNEECDDGNSENGDGCDENCTVSRCGNGVIGSGEECDDGNVLNGDGCDIACLIEECGNGRREGNEACDDGNLEDGDGCEATCTLTPQINAALIRLNPLVVKLPVAATEVTKNVRVVVRNADSNGLQVLRLSASTGTCPPGTIQRAPDFSASIDGIQDSVALTPGQRATAQLQLRFARSDFAGVHARAPRRCQIELTLEPVDGSVDADPTNDGFLLSIDVFDRAAPRQGVDESYIRAARPILMRIPAGLLAVEKDVTLRARSVRGASPSSFTAENGDCPPGTVTLVSQDPAGRVRLRLRAARAFFTTPSRLSPSRCTAQIFTSGAPDTDPSNNDTALVIDVVDMNDLE